MADLSLENKIYAPKDDHLKHFRLLQKFPRYQSISERDFVNVTNFQFPQCNFTENFKPKYHQTSLKNPSHLCIGIKCCRKRPELLTSQIGLGGPGESRETFGGVVKSDVG
jgi:hypothetical protein